MNRTKAAVAAATLALVVSGCGGGFPPIPESPSAAAAAAQPAAPSAVLPGCAVTGVVRESPGGAPSAGASVDIVKEPGGHSAPAIWSATTDASGTYGIGGIDCGISRIVRVGKADFFPDEASVLFDGNQRRDVTLARVTYLLAGTVRDFASRTPLPDATVEILSGPYAGQRATTHFDGSYGLSARDTVTIRAFRPGYQPQDATVTVTAPAAHRDFLLTTR